MKARQTGRHQLFRSSKKLAFTGGPGRRGDGDFDDDGALSTFSTSSWSTVASTTVGGASLLSGVSCASTAAASMTSENIKKPWRQMSASKKANRDTAPGGGRKRKEKLRRVYVDLDRHAVE